MREFHLLAFVNIKVNAKMNKVEAFTNGLLQGLVAFQYDESRMVCGSEKRGHQQASETGS